MENEEFLEFERGLQSRALTDPNLRSKLGQIIERENVRRTRLNDGTYAEMRFP